MLSNSDRIERYTAATLLDEKYESHIDANIEPILRALAVELDTPEYTPEGKSRPGFTHLLHGVLLNLCAKSNSIPVYRKFIMSRNEYEQAAGLTAYGRHLYTHPSTRNASELLTAIERTQGSPNRTLQIACAYALQAFPQGAGDGHMYTVPDRILRQQQIDLMERAVSILIKQLSDYRPRRPGFSSVYDNPAVTAAYALREFGGFAAIAIDDLAKMQRHRDPDCMYEAITAMHLVGRHTGGTRRKVTTYFQRIVVDSTQSEHARAMRTSRLRLASRICLFTKCTRQADYTE